MLACMLLPVQRPELLSNAPRAASKHMATLSVLTGPAGAMKALVSRRKLQARVGKK